MMVGRTLDTEFPTVGARAAAAGGQRIEPWARPCAASFEVRRRSAARRDWSASAGPETARLIFAADRRDAGTVSLDGRTLNLHSPRMPSRPGFAC
jgi:ribose transport system ATP-binding protein/rhamnose transport system ATP-binding protein